MGLLFFMMNLHDNNFKLKNLLMSKNKSLEYIT